MLATEPARVDKDRIHEFLASFQLAMKRTWDKPRVAERVRHLSSDVVPTVSDLVQSLAVDLQACILSKNAGEQTSAASKFIFFARPNDDVFIWDRLARMSAAFRERVRQGRPISSNSLRKHFVDGSDYPRYHLACANIWHEERERSDFRNAVDTFVAFLRGTGGPMMEGQIVTQRFIERRLLDKLMFCEGQILEKMFKSDSPAA